MDIAAISSVMQQNSLSLAVGISVLKMSNDQVTEVGQNLVKMMEQSVQPHLGSTLDIMG